MRLSRSPNIAAAVMFVGGWLTACSTPAPDPGAVAAKPTRDVRLVQPIAAEVPQVSELEAGRPLRPVQARRRRANPVALLRLDQAPAVSAIAVTVPESSQPLVQTPVPVPVPVAADEPVTLVGAGLSGPSYSSQPSYGIGRDPAPGGRDPVIIIRGGRGGVDDDCDLHRPGSRRGPIAINQIAPPRMSFPRAGIR